MEILNVKVLLPATVEYCDNSGNRTVFVYFDPITGDCVIPEGDYDGVDLDDLKQSIKKYVIDQRKAMPSPTLPKNAFDKLNSESYLNKDRE